MTTINCSFDCAHQKDGKCTLDNINANPVSSIRDCLFFQERPPKLGVDPS